MGAIMLFSLFLLLFSLRPAAAQKSVDIANIQMPAYLGTMTSAANPCTSAKQFVSAIRLHPRGGKVQIYTVQVLDSANNWQTLNVAGVLPANKDTDWLPLTVGLNRCCCYPRSLSAHSRDWCRHFPLCPTSTSSTMRDGLSQISTSYNGSTARLNSTT